MNLVIHLIVIDNNTGQVWKTPNHNDNSKKDDYHRDIKPIIIRDLPKKLKNLFGENCNIEIRNDEIYILSRIFDDKTGKRVKKRIRTDLKAENYFDKIAKYMLFTIINELDFSGYDCINIKVIKENSSFNYIIELTVRNHDVKLEDH